MLKIRQGFPIPHFAQMLHFEPDEKEVGRDLLLNYADNDVTLSRTKKGKIKNVRVIAKYNNGNDFATELKKFESGEISWKELMQRMDQTLDETAGACTCMHC
eukprot:TRINITY_DN39132_c0_g1_i4.p1 TRINITY_DN39132_c0_g1~~TRINITY_DN39132_c0_g1_i4.p1  ORF type:complete len:102 (-),score=26.99 TRINITY_DN39132_c0_g1_i4:35-340(-)